MNCKPNDLAVIVRTAGLQTGGVIDSLIGSVVTVVESFESEIGKQWIVQSALSAYAQGMRIWVCTLPDAVLQPLRPIANRTKVHRAQGCLENCAA